MGSFPKPRACGNLGISPRARPCPGLHLLQRNPRQQRGPGSAGEVRVLGLGLGGRRRGRGRNGKPLVTVGAWQSQPPTGANASLLGHCGEAAAPCQLAFAELDCQTPSPPSSSAGSSENSPPLGPQLQGLRGAFTHPFLFFQGSTPPLRILGFRAAASELCKPGLARSRNFTKSELLTPRAPLGPGTQ